MSLASIVSKIAGKRIVVIGDIMLDRYLWGKVSRISPEAPVPVVLMEKETLVPGGASNVANNITALGGSCDLVGVVGRDAAADKLLSRLSAAGIGTGGVVADQTRPTIQKTRVMGNRQQIIRMDKEDKTPIGAETEQAIISEIKKKTQNANAIILSDYAKGTLTDAIIAAIHAAASEKRILLICDGKPNNKAWFKGSHLITPNRKEAYAMAGASEHERVENVGEKLCHYLSCNVLITLSEQGMLLTETNGKQTQIPTTAREVFDVSGAGDTAVSAIALCVASGASLADACRIGNFAAGIVVAKLGTSICSPNELQKAIEGGKNG